MQVQTRATTVQEMTNQLNQYWKRKLPVAFNSIWLASKIHLIDVKITGKHSLSTTSETNSWILIELNLSTKQLIISKIVIKSSHHQWISIWHQIQILIGHIPQKEPKSIKKIDTHLEETLKVGSLGDNLAGEHAPQIQDIPYLKWKMNLKKMNRPSLISDQQLQMQNKESNLLTVTWKMSNQLWAWSKGQHNIHKSLVLTAGGNSIKKLLSVISSHANILSLNPKQYMRKWLSKSTKILQQTNHWDLPHTVKWKRESKNREGLRQLQIGTKTTSMQPWGKTRNQFQELMLRIECKIMNYSVKSQSMKNRRV